MKLCKNIAIAICVLGLCSCAHVAEQNKLLLPDKYPVFSHGNTVVNHSYPKFAQKALPVNNSYNKNPGCYLACYSHNPQAVYNVTPTIFVEGMVRVKGEYDGRNCIPKVFHSGDISASIKYKNLCNEKLPSCKETQNITGEGCWAGEDTGGFYGIQ